MSIDVTEINRVRANTVSVTAPALATAQTGAISACTGCFQTRLFGEVANTTLWGSIPSLTGTTTTLCIGCVDSSNTSHHFMRCGANCSWVVPGGVTTARFELWGPGAGTGSGCCCGGSLHGATGAYVSVIASVTPGCTYTVCAGCAVCCYAVWAGYDSGGSSFVTGPNMCICAPGGAARLYDMTCQTRGLGSFACGTGAYGPIFGYNENDRSWLPNGCCCAWLNICNSGGDYCVGGSSAGYCHGRQTFFYNRNHQYGCVCNNTASMSIVPSTFSAFNLDNSHYGCRCHPPIPGFASTYTVTAEGFTTGTCGGWQCSAWCTYCLNSGNMACVAAKRGVPGSGGYGVHVMGGNTTQCGDSGRGGLVRITYC